MNKVLTVRLPEQPFGFAQQSAQMWFDWADTTADQASIRVGSDEIGDEMVRERLISLIGNTPGLTEAFVDAGAIDCLRDGHSIEICIMHDDEVDLPNNNPRANALRVREMLEAATLA
jgi:hypothetical protein